MKSVMHFLIGLALSSQVLAAEILIAGKPGGLSGNLGEILAAQNQDLSVKYAGSCKLAQRQFESGQSEINLLPLAYTVVGDCRMPIKRENLIDVVYGQTLAMCHDRSRANLGASHFLSAREPKIIFSMARYKDITENWINDLNASKNTKVIVGGTSTQVLQASFTNEGDYFLFDLTRALQQQDRLSCLFNTGRTTVQGIPSLSVFGPAVRFPETYNIQLVFTPDPAKVSQYRAMIQKSKNTDKFKEFTKDPGIVTEFPGDQWAFVETQQKMLLDAAGQ